MLIIIRIKLSEYQVDYLCRNIGDGHQKKMLDYRIKIIIGQIIHFLQSKIIQTHRLQNIKYYKMSDHPNFQQPHNNQRNGQQLEPQGGIMLSRPLPPTLLRINADNQDKRAVCIFWIVFFVVIVAITIASSFLPVATFKITNTDQGKGSNLEGCQNPVQFDNFSILNCQSTTTPQIKNYTIGALILDLQRQNQFAVVFANAYLVDNKATQKQLQTNVTVTFHTVVEDNLKNGTKIFKSIDKVTTNQNFKFVYQDSFKILAEDGVTVKGYQIPIFIVRNFKQQSFVLLVKFAKNITQYENISEIKTSVLLVNPQFTKYSFAIRYIFFISSLAACIIYIVRFCKIPVRERILQQKMIVALSVLCVFFNDPFYPITVMQPNKVSSYFSVFFVINFVIFLIFLWIIFLDRILYEDGQKETNLFNWKRILYIVITYILVLVLYTMIAMDHIQGLPVVPTQDLFAKNIVLLSLAVLLFVLLGFCYIIVSYIRLCMKADELLWRNQLFLFFSVFFIIMTIALFFVNGFEVNSFAGNRVLLLYTVMNMYTFYLQYMYSISNEQRQRVRRGQVQQNSMGLLQVKSGDGDCVDLQFDDMPGLKIQSDDKFQNKLSNKTAQVKKLMIQKQQSNQMFTPKFEDYYSKDLQKANKQKINEERQQVDFFKQNNQGQKDKQVEKKDSKQSEFDQFSLQD